MIIPSTTAILFLLMTPARGQSSRPPIDAVQIDGIIINIRPMADNEKVVQWKVLAARNGIDSPKALTTKARKNLMDTDKLKYHFQRVEVTGVMSVDDTEESMPDMFDKQVKPSHFNEVLPSRSPLVNRLKKYFAFGTDMVEAVSDTRGIPSARSQLMIDKLKGERINELFAHSWGTEIVYLGLLNGDIIPPKKLFIVGVPEANEEKWLMLAKFTGIEVHVVGFEWDKLKVAGDRATKLKSGLPQDTAGLDKLWRESCALRDFRGCADPAMFVRTKFDYNVGVRPPDAPKDEFFKMHLSKLDHDRMLYYRYLYDRKLFTKTAAQMDAPQMRLVRAEENRLLASAMDEAQNLVKLAREQAEIANHSYSLPESNQLTMQPFWSRDSEATMRRLAELKKLPPEAVAVQPVPPPPFSRALPKLKDFAVAACRAPEQVAFEMFLTPYYDHSYRAYDDDLAGRLASGLDDCPRRLFYKMIELLRAHSWRQADRRWIRSAVAEYSRLPETPPGNYLPPASGGNGGGYNGGNRGGGGSVSPPAPPPVTHDPEGEALEQLREIERRKRWGLRPVM